MALYHTETVMKNGSREVVILEAPSSTRAMNEAHVGHIEDGKEPAYTPIKRKISKKQALELIANGARCWASI